MKWPMETLRLFPTFVCTRRCGYCVVDTHGKPPQYNLIKSKVYGEFLSTVEGVKLLVISGGEPALYPGLDVLIGEGLARAWNVGVYSNCSKQMVDFVKTIEPNDHFFIDCSYHADYEDVHEYAARWMDIWTRGFRITAATIIHPHNADKVYRDILSFYRLTGHRMLLKPLDGVCRGQWYSDHAEFMSVYGSEKVGRCFRRDLVVAPDGDIYHCHRYMYTHTDFGVIGSIGVDTPVELKELECWNINKCNTCDAGCRRIDGEWERKQ